jgi:hypothetical protein
MDIFPWDMFIQILTIVLAASGIGIQYVSQLKTRTIQQQQREQDKIEKEKEKREKESPFGRTVAAGFG